MKDWADPLVDQKPLHRYPEWFLLEPLLLFSELTRGEFCLM